MRLKINQDKTKYLIVPRLIMNKQNIDIDQYTVEQVDYF